MYDGKHSPDGTYHFLSAISFRRFHITVYLCYVCFHLWSAHTHMHSSCMRGKPKNKRLSRFHCKLFALMIISYGAKVFKHEPNKERKSERKMYVKKHFTSGQTCILCFESNKKKVYTPNYNNHTHGLYFIEIVFCLNLCLFCSVCNHARRRNTPVPIILVFFG